jgi:hypothetical protein
MPIPGYYTADEIATRFHWGRDMVSKTARARGWDFVQVGRSKIFAAADVDAYDLDRQRTDLLRRTGWLKMNGSRLVRDDSYDSECPTCGAFAVEKPPASGADVEPVVWLCENGHGSDALPHP